MTEVNKEELRRLAEAASKGPWWITRDLSDVRDDHDELVFDAAESKSEDARFVVAANPAAVISLLDENDQLRAEVESLRAQLKACHPFRPAHEPVTVFAPGCLVCGQYTDHGGLQCPKTRAACTAQEVSAND